MGCQVLTLAELPFSSLPSHRLGLLNLVQRTKPDLRPREREGRLDHRRRATRPAVGDNAPDVPSTSFPRRLSSVAGVAPSQRCLRQNPCPRGTPFPGSDPRAPLPPVLNADGQLLNSEVAGRFALAMQSQYTPWEASRLPMLRRTHRRVPPMSSGVCITEPRITILRTSTSIIRSLREIRRIRRHRNKNRTDWCLQSN